MHTLPPMTTGKCMMARDVTATQRFTQQPARYTEASLVRTLEELGIGRPSTYAPTISTIQARGYVEKGESKGTKRDYEVMMLAGDKIETTRKSELTGA